MSGHLRTARTATEESIGLNEAQRRALFDPSPECDSLAEQIVSLRHDGVSVARLRALLATVRAVIELNAREGDQQRMVCGELERLRRVLDGGERMQRALTVRGLIEQLRDPLEILASPSQAEAAQLVNARNAVHQVIATAPRERLTCPKFGHELGRLRHERLLRMIEATS